MSNSASIAAAKKRRSQQPNIQPQFQNQTINNLENPHERNTNPRELLKEHDYKIFCLEKKINEEYQIENRMDLLQLNESKFNNSITNQVESNSANILSNNTKITTLTKNINEMNTLIQTMHATILSQTTELNELKKVFSKYNEEKNISESEEPSA